MEESLLHAIISTNVLENIPCVLLVDFPRKEAHNKGSQGDNAWNGDKVRLDIVPELCRGDVWRKSVVRLKDIKGLGNLIHLDSGVNHEGEVREADTNDLNSVLLAESIPYDNQCIQETENEKRQEGRNCLVLRLDFGVGVMCTKVDLELAKDVTKSGVSKVRG